LPKPTEVIRPRREEAPVDRGNPDGARLVHSEVVGGRGRAGRGARRPALAGGTKRCESISRAVGARGSWLGPGNSDYYENILVEAKGGFASLDVLLQAETNYISGLADMFGYAPTDTTVCGNHPAKYLSYTYSSSSGLPITAEVVIAVFGTTAYSARYSKSISQNADAAAERSLTTLCGRATPQ
jgi:hypothetical protein